MTTRATRAERVSRGTARFIAHGYRKSDQHVVQLAHDYLALLDEYDRLETRHNALRTLAQTLVLYGNTRIVFDSDGYASIVPLAHTDWSAS